MVQGRGRLRFPVKAFQSAGVFSQLFWKKLQSDETAERSVLGLVDHTHAAAAQLFNDAVVRDGLFDHWCEGTQGCHVRSGAQAKSTNSNTLSAVEGASRAT